MSKGGTSFAVRASHSTHIPTDLGLARADGKLHHRRRYLTHATAIATMSTPSGSSS
jgi:hypothetical protein